MESAQLQAVDRLVRDQASDPGRQPDYRQPFCKVKGPYSFT
jgi:hypothetical protein